MDNYVCYHLHTENSLLDSCTNYKLYVDKAVALGQRAIAFTEHGNIYNWIEKKMYCDAKGIKYIHGCEVYLTEQLEPKVRDNYHTILLAKNEDGRNELNLLVGMATNPDHFYYKPRLSFEEFFNISNNIIKISACLASPLRQYPGSLVRTDEMTDEEYQAEVTKKKKVFSDLLSAYDYYEIQPHVKSREQILYNQFLYKASQEYHKPLIAATDTHSLDEYKQQCRKILLLAKNITFTNEEEFDLTYKSYDELVEMFRQQGSLPMDVILDAINNTNVMADSIEDFQLDPTVKYPRLYPTQKEEELALRKRIVERLKYKLEHGIIKAENLDKYKANILEEMKVFKQIDMTGFMLFMSDLISWCWDNGIPTGFCRGSVGGSTVAFITDIIDLDPVVWNTVFSRFANIDRKEVGDIDVDLSPDQRELVYNHIIESFGQDKTAYILAIGTISDKGTIDEIGRALKIPLDEVANIKLEYTQCVDAINAAQTTLDALVQKEAKEEEINKAQEILDKANKNMETLQRTKYKELFYYFPGLNGTAISQSMHPAGIVVSPITLPDNFGTFWNDGKQILYINMEEIHDGAGLVKYDLLGLKNVEIIRKTCEYAGIPYPKSYTINWEDDKVWDDMITSPVGIFQFESASAAHMLKQFRPHKINDMSIVNAALRPSGASYRDRLLSGEINHNPSKLIDNLLANNNGYLIFQEDTIKFLQNICGMTGSEADNIRRAIGRISAA